MVTIASTTKQRGAELHEQAEAGSPTSRVNLRRAALVSGGLATALTVDAMLHEQTRFDAWMLDRVQGIGAAGLADAVYAVSALTGSTGAIMTWALVLLFFVGLRKWLPALATLTLPVGGALNHIVGEYLVGRTRPDTSDAVRTVPDIEAASFPSGHVMGAVMLYGLLFFLARRIEQTALRLLVQVGSAGVILGVGFARVWEGAHWPTDVIGAYAFGGLFLVALFAAYNRIDVAVGHLSFVHAGEVAHDETTRHAHALTSLVTFNTDGTVSKVYNPGFLPRALYWLAFQAGFPYERNRAAAQAALERRNLAGMLTEFWYGENRVARIVRIDPAGERLELVSELVNGHAATDRVAAKRFLVDLRARFEAAGFPTWQIDPRQPRAVDNVLQTTDGRYTIVDLESGLVSPLASVKTWLRSIRRGQVPIFDTVHFDITRDYVATHEAAMRRTMGDAWVADVRQAIDRAEAAAEAWYASEPRVWSVLAQPQTWVARIQQRTAAGQEKAMGWLTGSVSTWETEGRISATEATALRAEMDTPQFQAVVPHLGAHVVISILLRFPFGSIARASWSAAALLGATGRLLARRIDRAVWRQAFSIHNPLVIALAAIPGFGTFAYLAAGPIRSNRLLMRVTVDAMMFKMPWRLYERTGMRRLVVIGRSANAHGTSPSPVMGEPAVTAAFGQPWLPAMQPGPILAAQGAGAYNEAPAVAWD